MDMNSSDLQLLYTEIKTLKENLYILLKYNDLTSENVVRCSQKLDKIISIYQKYKKFN
jgi:hypothetical protein